MLVDPIWVKHDTGWLHCKLIDTECWDGFDFTKILLNFKNKFSYKYFVFKKLKFLIYILHFAFWYFFSCNYFNKISSIYHTISPLKKKQVSGFQYIHKVVQPSSLSNYRIFSSPQKETLYPLAVTPIPSLPNAHYWQPLIYFSGGR